MSNKIQLNLLKYIYGHRSDVIRDYVDRVSSTIDRLATIERELRISTPFENVAMGIYEARPP